jgi:two-component sensor histidine kinase
MEFLDKLRLPDEQVLLHELNHRVNNELAAAIGAVSCVAARSSNDEVKAVLAEVADLLHHYADVHRALQMPEHDMRIDAVAYLRQLCLSISRSKLDHRKIKLVLAARPLWERADRCWRLGMIVHELITNAARHAFANSGGEIRVKLRRTGAIVKCSVLDNGSAAASVHPGRGLKIINELSKALDGRFEQKFEPRGSTSILIFPYDAGVTVERGSQRGIARMWEQATSPALIS